MFFNYFCDMNDRGDRAACGNKQCGLRLGGIFTMALAAGAFLVLNLLTPEYHDDFVYKFMFEGGAVSYGHPVRSIGDIFLSQLDHYCSVNGRSIVHFLVQLFSGLLGKSVFNIFNAVVFATFLWLLQRHSRRGTASCLSVLVTLALVLLLPRFKDTFLWMTGSINYLWSAVAVLAFLLIYDKRHEQPFDKTLPLTFVASLLIGWTHEGITLPLAAALMIINLLAIKKSRGREQGLWLALALMIGGCIAALAPGTVARSGMTGGLAPSALALKLITGLTVMARLKLVYLALLASVAAWLHDRDALKRVFSRDGYLLLAVLLSLGIVFVSGMESTRTAFGLELFSLIYLLRLLAGWQPCRGKSLQRWCCVILSIGLIIFYGLLLRHTIASWQESRNLIAQIERTTDGIIATNEHDAACFSSFVCTMLSPDSTVNAMNYDAHGWPASIAATYHRDSLVFLPQAFLEDLKAHPERYETLDLGTPFEFYVQHIDDDVAIENVTFELAPNDFSDVPLLFRPVARRMNRYTDTSVPTTKWATVTLFGNRYLLVKKDRTLARRLLGIDILYDR